MTEKNKLRLPRLIPCLLLPPIAAAVFYAVNLTDLFDGILAPMYQADGDFGLTFVFVVFPALVLLAGIVPAVLLNARERKVWSLYAVLFFAAYFVLYILLIAREEEDPDPFRIYLLLWFMLAPGVILCHLLPSWVVSGVRKMKRGKKEKRG